MSVPAPQIDYEPGAASRRRKTRRRWAALVALIAVVVAVVWQGPAAKRRLVRAYWEHRVASHVAPADRVVYEEDPGRWPALLAQPGYRRMPASSPGWSDHVALANRPVERLAEITELRLGSTALFAHARRTPGGRERLVVVWAPSNAVRPNAQGATPDNQVRLHLSVSVVDGEQARVTMRAPWIAPQSVAENRTTPLYARLYAGQVDPADPTHFTIPFEIGDHADVLDGYLRDDDKVDLRPRKLDHPLNPK